MNLPFGLTGKRWNSSRRREVSTGLIIDYEHRLVEYRDSLERYRQCLTEYENRLNGHEKRSLDHQLSIVQNALDLTYLKEQGEKITNQLEELKGQGPDRSLVSNIESLASTILDVSYKVDGLDRNVINRITEFLLELQKQSGYNNKQLQQEISAEVDMLCKSVRKGHSLLWFLLSFCLLNLAGIVFLVLYIMEIIPF